MMEKQEVCNQHTAETRNNENICFYSSWILKMSLVMIWSCCLRGRIDKKKQHLKTLNEDAKVQALDPSSSKKNSNNTVDEGTCTTHSISSLSQEEKNEKSIQRAHQE